MTESVLGRYQGVRPAPGVGRRTVTSGPAGPGQAARVPCDHGLRAADAGGRPCARDPSSEGAGAPRNRNDRGVRPRYLHSTGQLHKGGPASGLFLQLTTDHDPDVAVSGKPYTFGTLADAQALGDLEPCASGRRAARAQVARSGRSDILRLGRPRRPSRLLK